MAVGGATACPISNSTRKCLKAQARFFTGRAGDTDHSSHPGLAAKLRPAKDSSFITSFGCQIAARIAETYVTNPGHSERLEIFSQEDGRSARRELRVRATAARTGEHDRTGPPASSKEIFLVLVLRKQKFVLSQTSRPPVLPVKSQGLEATGQGTAPKGPSRNELQ
jgi:hypothetical protein